MESVQSRAEPVAGSWEASLPDPERSRPELASPSDAPTAGRIRRVFYAAAGPGDLIASHLFWKAGEHNPTEVSVTFSSQIEQYCRDIGAEAWLVSMHPDGRKLEDGPFTLEHRPKPVLRGAAYHIEEMRYALGLLKSARAFGADVALIDSGVTHYFAMSLFRWAGIPVVPILHNTLWPAGFRWPGLKERVYEWLDGWFFRRDAAAILAVSPEAERQVRVITRKPAPIHQIRAQFLPEFFQGIPPAPPHGDKPFQVMFVGRVDESKGVLDIPDMAASIERRQPGLVRWVVCGRGPALEELEAKVAALGVGHVVDVRGWVSLDDLRQVYAQSHAAIVPTRSLFEEGLAMTAVEAVLAGRPLITNPVVPALELVAPAAIAARSNDAESHADQVFALATDADLYEKLRAATSDLGVEFYDRSLGLTAMLRRVLG